MRVQYVPIDGELVSREWGIALNAMREDGIAFRVNEGHRTWARQAQLRALYLAGRGALTAIPSRTAPHIRTGRIDHAIDFTNAAAAIRWLRAHGLNARPTVPGESWHVEVPATDLIRFARRNGNGDPIIRPYYVRPFRPNHPVGVTRLQKLLRGLHLTNVVNGRYGIWTRRAVRRFQLKHGLKVDGVVGPATWRALRRASSK